MLLRPVDDVVGRAGNRADKQDALGVSEAMMTIYDLSVPRVKPSELLDFYGAFLRRG